MFSYVICLVSGGKVIIEKPVKSHNFKWSRHPTTNDPEESVNWHIVRITHLVTHNWQSFSWQWREASPRPAYTLRAEEFWARWAIHPGPHSWGRPGRARTESSSQCQCPRHCPTPPGPAGVVLWLISQDKAGCTNHLALWTEHGLMSL